MMLTATNKIIEQKIKISKQGYLKFITYDFCESMYVPQKIN